jgi:K+-transporting ATPase KdpF subunit
VWLFDHLGIVVFSLLVLGLVIYLIYSMLHPENY